ncbi:GIY-YIG nuclease family protein [Spartinivicinus ruber]|uniref:GIY-YIG nuclease family protein n=1 Tax=Spartinivicinus ruber TaxID=2683272 RepID=UPI0013D7A283|nr:GIY-YIG nuclease family protein [Spartinivicinus ruber]
MIIFTITNKVTGQVFVGSTRNSLESQWAKIVSAAEQGLDYPLYNQICRYGDDQFDVEEWDYAETRDELLALEQEAVDSLQAESLRGYKTAVNQRRVTTTAKKRTTTSKPKPSTNDAVEATDKTEATTKQSDAKEQVDQPEIKQEPTPQPVIPQEKPVSILAQLTANAKAYKRSKADQAKPVANTAKQTAAIDEIDSEQLDSLLAKVSAYSTQAKPAPEQQPAEVINNSDLSTKVDTQPTETPELVCNENQQRILAAVNKQRKLRSERTPTIIEQERKQLADLLAKLESRAIKLKQPATAS